MLDRVPNVLIVDVKGALHVGNFFFGHQCGHILYMSLATIFWMMVNWFDRKWIWDSVVTNSLKQRTQKPGGIISGGFSGWDDSSFRCQKRCPEPVDLWLHHCRFRTWEWHYSGRGKVHSFGLSIWRIFSQPRTEAADSGQWWLWDTFGLLEILWHMALSEHMII